MTAETWSAIAAVIAAAIGGIALFAAWQSAQAARTLTEIERRRWHHELTPQFEISCDAIMNGQSASDMADLRIRFTGPTGLTALTIQPAIRDDRHRQAIGIGKVTQEQIEAQIWGPYRFRRGVDGEAEEGRTVAAFELSLDDTRKLALDRTQHPRWWADPATWPQEYAASPVRLRLHCNHPGYEPWIIHLDVDVHS